MKKKINNLETGKLNEKALRSLIRFYRKLSLGIIYPELVSLTKDDFKELEQLMKKINPDRTG